jgi:hypothetical protein
MSRPAATVTETTAPTAKITLIIQTNPEIRSPALNGSSKPPGSERLRKKRTPQYKAKAEKTQYSRNRLLSPSFTLRIDAREAAESCFESSSRA